MKYVYLVRAGKGHYKIGVANNVLNRVKAHKGHSVLSGIQKMKQNGKFELDLRADTVKFIRKLFGTFYVL